MGKFMIVNGSPRAACSNSKQYIAIFQQYYTKEATLYEAVSRRFVSQDLSAYSDILLVFPLYVDALPSVLMEFLKVLETCRHKEMCTIHIMINCGFFEVKQMDTALQILRLYCRKNGFAIGMTLRIASGEAILRTPFAALVRQRIRQFAKGMKKGRKKAYAITMPLPKRLFVKASKRYWITYGASHHITEEALRTMDIEG